MSILPLLEMACFFYSFCNQTSAMEKLEDFFKKTAHKIYGQTPDEAKDKQICISCKSEASSFRDEL